CCYDFWHYLLIDDFLVGIGDYLLLNFLEYVSNSTVNCIIYIARLVLLDSTIAAASESNLGFMIEED
ncbi:hypothetical protein ACJX0J_007146, partial [Zea mays]